MSVFLVSYDLKGLLRDYTPLFEEIKKSGGWWHYLDSTWLISTHENADEIYNRLNRHIDKEDRLLVIQVEPHYQGWLPHDAWKWLDQNMGHGRTSRATVYP